MLKSAPISKTVLTVTVSGFMYLLSTTSGLAGFEWIPTERPPTQPAAPAQQEAPMQVMEAPVAHVTGEPLQSPAAAPAPQAPVVQQAAPALQQMPTAAATPASAPIIQQIPAPAPAPAESHIMTPSPFDAPTPAPAPMAAPTPASAPAQMPAPTPVMVQPAAPAPIAAPQRQAVIPTPIAEPQSLVNAEKPALHVPPPISYVPQQPEVSADVQNMQQQQANAALEAEKLMQSMTAANTAEPAISQEPAPAVAPTPAPAPVSAPAAEPVIIPAITDTADMTAPAAPALNAAAEPQQQPATDYTAQALAQMAEPRIEAIDPQVSAPATVEPALEPVTSISERAPTATASAEPAALNPAQPTEDADSLTVAEQAALKAEAAKKMLEQRAAQASAQPQEPAIITDAAAETSPPADIPSLDVVEQTGEAPVMEQAEKEVIILPPVDTVSAREEALAATDNQDDYASENINEQLEKEMAQSTAPANLLDEAAVDTASTANKAAPMNETSAPADDMLLAGPDADSLVQAQENVVIPAVDTTLPNEAQLLAPIDTAEAPLAPEAEAITAEAAQAVETATETETPLAPVAPVTANAEASGEYEVVYGFGEDMPLALALQQIVPEGYAYSFAKSVNPGLRVTWEGDRAWNVVLNETLGSVGLKAHIAGNAVTVMQSGDQLTTSSPVTNDHPEAKAFDVMWDMEPAAGVEKTSSSSQENASEVGLIAPLESVSPEASELPKNLSKKTIKDPGENPSQQPSLTEASLTAQPQDMQQLDQKPAENAIQEVAEDLSAEPKSEDPHAKGVWAAEKGQSLKKVLYSWSQKGNVQIIWEAAHDYIVADNVRVEGSLDDAMVTLFKVSMAEDNYPSVRIIESQRNSGKTAMVIVQDPTEENTAQIVEPAEITEG